MRDQYAGDISDVLKFAFLRALAGTDRRLGIAWYYDPGDDGRADGRHLEWHGEAAWRVLDEALHAGLTCLPERSIVALEQAKIWPEGALFHREPMPLRNARMQWAARKREALDGADIVFLDPDNGLGNETKKHATFSEVRELKKTNRTIAFITFPGRSMKHDALLQQLHLRLKSEADAESVVTLRTNVSVPNKSRLGSVIQRQRWFTLVDPDIEILLRVKKFAAALSTIPRVKAQLDGND